MRENKKDIIKVLSTIAILIAIMVVASLFCSCGSSKQVVYVHDTINHNSINYEYIHDSVYIDRNHIVYQQGDTIFVQDSIYVYKYLVTHDTTIDTMMQTLIEKVPYEVVKEKKVHGFFWWIGLLAVIAGIGYLCYVAYTVFVVTKE